MSRTTDQAVRGSSALGLWLAIAFGAALVLYVALCTPQRQNLWEADAWEHHRAIVALVENPDDPGNPTYASGEPSIRYSPYSVALASIARNAGVDSYDLLGAAAVFNTALLVVGLLWLLAGFGELALAPAALLLMVTLYGGAPGYAGSLALADLPCHQVNPSAFGAALAFWAFGLFERMLRVGRAWLWAAPIGIAIAIALALLSHGMVGVFTGAGLVALALASARPVRAGLLAVGLCVAGAALALLWPWYDLWRVIVEPADPQWYNPFILAEMLGVWCLPGLLAAACALPLRARPLVRFALLGGALCYGAGLFAPLVRSAAFARMPLVGVTFFHLAAAAFVVEYGLLRPWSWIGRVRDLASAERSRSAPALVEVVLLFSILYFGLPQMYAILREPHLGRPYLAPLLGREDRQLALKDRMDAFLVDVGPRDVVLSDALTSWPVPSTAGRVVAALHYEYFVPDQPTRTADVERFFSVEGAAEREALLAKYGVRWIFLNQEQIPARVFDDLLDADAVVRRDGPWVLLDAQRWRAPEGRG